MCPVVGVAGPAWGQGEGPGEGEGQGRAWAWAWHRLPLGRSEGRKRMAVRQTRTTMWSTSVARCMTQMKLRTSRTVATPLGPPLPLGESMRAEAARGGR